ncbi:hypothetical protein ACIPY6_03080 [Streptomyces sp. NPDC090054]|uniref:hypothetical protein n=1 Tax=Streptomyces sp. NPDC090054 TaxID=3365933 RepID=UPI00382052DA
MTTQTAAPAGLRGGHPQQNTPKEQHAMTQPTPLPEGFTAHTCVSVQCTLCGYFYDEDEGYRAHVDSAEEARSSVVGHGWHALRDGRVLCPADDPDHEGIKAAVGLAPEPGACPAGLLPLNGNPTEPCVETGAHEQHRNAAGQTWTDPDPLF